MKNLIFLMLISILWVPDGGAIGPDDMDQDVPETVTLMPESSTEAILRVTNLRRCLEIIRYSLERSDPDNFNNGMGEKLTFYITLLAREVDDFEADVAKNGPEFNEGKLERWHAIQGLMRDAIEFGEQARKYADAA